MSNIYFFSPIFPVVCRYVQGTWWKSRKTRQIQLRSNTFYDNYLYKKQYVK